MAGDLTFNKIAAAILATALGVMLIKEVSHGAIHVEKQKKFAYLSAVGPGDLPVVKEEIKLPFPQADWVAAMDAEKGEKYFKVCKACHDVTPGPSKLAGPSLWNIMDRPSGSTDGFSYSAGMSGMNINWGYEELDNFLTNPKRYVKGTNMGFGGEGKDAKRAAIIEYLRTLSDNPVDRPEAVAAELPADDMVEDIDAPAEGGDAVTVIEEIVTPEITTPETVAPKVVTPATITEGATEMETQAAGDVMDGAETAADMVADEAVQMVDKAQEMANDGVGDIPTGTDVMDMAKDVAEDKATDAANDVIEDIVEDVVEDKAKDLIPSDE